MNLSNCKTIVINNKEVSKIDIDNKTIWQKEREKKRIIDGNNFNVLVKDINGSGSTTETTDTTVTRFIFDYWNDSYETLLGNFTNGTDVSYSNDGSIRLFYNNTVVYVLSDYLIATYNANSMFRGFAETTEINFDNFDTSNCTDMALFIGICDKLERQTGMENFDTSNCTTMENMLRNIKFNKIGQDDTCDLNVSGWDTRKVITMRQMFIYNQATSIDISNFLTPVCVDFRGMFGRCPNLKTLNIENIDMSLCTGVSSGTPQPNASDFLQNLFVLENLVFCKNLGKGYVSGLSLYQASINLSQSNLLTHDSIMSVINNVATSVKLVKIYLGSTNYNKVTNEERAISYAKNWEAVYQSRN